MRKINVELHDIVHDTLFAMKWCSIIWSSKNVAPLLNIDMCTVEPVLVADDAVQKVATIEHSSSVYNTSIALHNCLIFDSLPDRTSYYVYSCVF